MGRKAQKKGVQKVLQRKRDKRKGIAGKYPRGGGEKERDKSWGTVTSGEGEDYIVRDKEKRGHVRRTCWTTVGGAEEMESLRGKKRGSQAHMNQGNAGRKDHPRKHKRLIQKGASKQNPGNGKKNPTISGRRKRGKEVELFTRSHAEKKKQDQKERKASIEEPLQKKKKSK